MKKSKRMQPLLKVAQSKEQTAATELGVAQHNLQAQMARLRELETYQSEYLSRFQQTGQAGMSVSTLQSYRSFLSKLEIALAQQKQSVKTASELVERRKKQWFASRDQVKIYNNVITRYVDDEIKREEKLEQKESDDRSQRSP